MKLAGSLLATVALTCSIATAHADDATRFVVMLGQDTTSIERFTRTATRTEIDQVGRAPKVLRRHFVYDYRGDALTHVNMVVTAPGSATPTQTLDGVQDGDSLRLEIHSGSAPVQRAAISIPPGTLVLANSSPWAAYETWTMRLAAGKPDSLRGNLFYLGTTPTLFWLSVRRLGRDSVVIANGHQDVWHARIDKTGRLLSVVPISGTGKFSVTRVAALDLDGLAASYAAREQAGTGLGMLSPRDSVVVQTGGAALWVDYGRPARRGRVIYGTTVPYGEVWRTGANAATQFRTDKALDFGNGVVVPAGFYTLWTIPSPDGWKLIVNSETGQWGTEHKAEHDLYRIDMKTSALDPPVERFTIGIEPAGAGGVLNLDWDRTRASAAFTVKP